MIDLNEVELVFHQIKRAPIDASPRGIFCTSFFLGQLTIQASSATKIMAKQLFRMQCRRGASGPFQIIQPKKCLDSAAFGNGRNIWCEVWALPAQHAEHSESTTAERSPDATIVGMDFADATEVLSDTKPPLMATQ